MVGSSVRHVTINVSNDWPGWRFIPLTDPVARQVNELYGQARLTRAIDPVATGQIDGQLGLMVNISHNDAESGQRRRFWYLAGILCDLVTGERLTGAPDARALAVVHDSDSWTGKAHGGRDLAAYAEFVEERGRRARERVEEAAAEERYEHALPNYRAAEGIKHPIWVPGTAG